MTCCFLFMNYSLVLLFSILIFFGKQVPIINEVISHQKTESLCRCLCKTRTILLRLWKLCVSLVGVRIQSNCLDSAKIMHAKENWAEANIPKFLRASTCWTARSVSWRFWSQVLMVVKFSQIEENKSINKDTPVFGWEEQHNQAVGYNQGRWDLLFGVLARRNYWISPAVAQVDWQRLSILHLSDIERTRLLSLVRDYASWYQATKCYDWS